MELLDTRAPHRADTQAHLDAPLGRAWRGAQRGWGLQDGEREPHSGLSRVQWLRGQLGTQGKLQEQELGYKEGRSKGLTEHSEGGETERLKWQLLD